MEDFFVRNSLLIFRSYNITNFLEDLKLLYRSCGVQGKGTTFIFTDQDIKEEVFLEYLNNILSSGKDFCIFLLNFIQNFFELQRRPFAGVISNLFTRDEQAEIVSELTPIMKRENPKRTLTQENVMEYFMQRTLQYLHVVFCFSPVRNSCNMASRTVSSTFFVLISEFTKFFQFFKNFLRLSILFFFPKLFQILLIVFHSNFLQISIFPIF